MEKSRIYKVTFENGTVHYGRVALSKGYSEKTYISNLLSGYKHNINNPLRVSMITEFEKRVVNEQSTLMCEIVFEGDTTESTKVKDGLIKNTKLCMNTRLSTINKSPKKQPLKVKKEYVKSLTNSNGEKLTYIDVDRVFVRKLSSVVNFKKKHPIKPNYVLSLKDIVII